MTITADKIKVSSGFYGKNCRRLSGFVGALPTTNGGERNHAAAGAPGCFKGWARAKASMVAREFAIREKLGNGAVSTLKNFAPAAWLARQMSASVIMSPWQ